MAKRLLLLFYDGECEECRDVLMERRLGKHLSHFWLQRRLDQREELDRAFALRALPTLFLLDCDKRVLLKEASLQGVEEVLRASMRDGLRKSRFLSD